MACTIWLLGYPDQALKRSHEALTLAQELSHPHSLALVLQWAALFHQCCGEKQLAQERTEAAIKLSTEQGFTLWAALANILWGWVLTGQEQEEGVAQINQGMTTARAIGAELWSPYHSALLAEGYEKMGKIETGMNVLTEALTQVAKTEEHWYEAELYRLKGELTLKQSRVPSLASRVANTQHPTPGTQVAAEAEACFLKAIEIARKQSAKSWELRATVSLARLWQQQGKRAAARQILAEIYNWFTEGFDTVDLQEAKALLEELESI